MTNQEITKATFIFLNNKAKNNSELDEMFNEILDENLNSTLFDANGVIDDVIEAIDEEDYEEDNYGDYPTLKLNDLFDILTQIM
jgi:hypothetical protein